MVQTRRVVTTVKNRQKVEDRRQHLISSAVKVFLKKGFHATTVREIGAAAGFTQGTIYNYVQSKDDILYLVCDNAVSAYQAAVRRALDGASTPGRIEPLIRAIVQSMYEHQDQIVLIYNESHALDRHAKRAVLARVEEFNLFVADMLATHGLAAGNLTLITNIVTFLPTIVALRRWDLKGKVGYDELVDGVTQFILRGLAPQTMLKRGPASDARPVTPAQ